MGSSGGGVNGRYPSDAVHGLTGNGGVDRRNAVHSNQEDRSEAGESNSVKYELVYSHIDRTRGAGTVNAGDQIGTIMDVSLENPDFHEGDFNHLHLGIRERANHEQSYDPAFLIHPVSG